MQAEAQSVLFLMDNAYYVPTRRAEAVTVADRSAQLEFDDPDLWWYLFYKGADWGAKQVQEGEETR